MIVNYAVKENDGNPKAKRLRSFDLIFQEARNLGFTPHYVIRGRETEKFLKSALSAFSSNLKFTYDTTPANSVRDRRFLTLLGSDNGRAQREMSNFHPHDFEGEVVIEIKIIPIDDDEEERNKEEETDDEERPAWSLLFTFGKEGPDGKSEWPAARQS